jgi:hypothetical protein
MSNKFKQLSAEQRKAPPRVGIPQVDPGEGKVTPPQPSPQPAPEPKPTALDETKEASVSSPPPAPADPRTLKVRKGETPIKMGWHMYPTRHRQVVYEAFMLEMKPWEVNETALAEYFERRYGKPSDSK